MTMTGVPDAPVDALPPRFRIGGRRFAVGLGLPVLAVVAVVSPVFAAVFGILLAVLAMHEAGHLVLGVRAGLVAQDLVVGSGPVVVRAQVGRTELVLKLFPLAGAVQWESLDAYMTLPVSTRSTIQVAGPAGNLISGVVALYAALVATGVPAAAAVGRAVKLAASFPAWIADVLLTGNVAPWAGLAGLTGSLSVALLMFFALIHLAMGLMQLMPIPPMDGGKLVLGVYEVLSRRSSTLPSPVVVAERTRKVGFFLAIYVGLIHPAIMITIRFI